MRIASIYNRPRREIELKMTPMIDVVFLLLVFFVWTASFQIVEHILPSQLSTAAGTQPQNNDAPPPAEDFDDIVVRVTWTGNSAAWQINQTSVGTLAEVRTRLESIAAIKLDATVIVHPEDTVPVRDVVNVYDIAKLAGFETIQLAAG